MTWLDFHENEGAKSVSEFTKEIKSLLEGHLPACWICGEISNLRRQASGHLYFTLKDQGAQLPAVMFRGNAIGIGFDVADGMEVNAYGEISVYEPYGRYQLIVRSMEESGAGRLHREYERLKRKLQSEGLFETDRKRELPILPQRVAFITSPTGAAIQDFIRILKRRGWRGRLDVIPSKVQGKGASEALVENLKFVEAQSAYDLILVGRGGGSLEDLWCFNDETFARAISNCLIPIISAVGHEIDFALSDFVADRRAETPSAAAEMISSSFLECAERVDVARRRIDDAVLRLVSERSNDLAALRLRMASQSPASNLEKAFLRFDDMGNRMNAALSASLSEKRHKFLDMVIRLGKTDPAQALREQNGIMGLLSQRLSHAFRDSLNHKSNRLTNIETQLRTLSPNATLNRGYAMLSSESGGLIASCEEAVKQGRIKATLKDGSIWLGESKAD